MLCPQCGQFSSYIHRRCIHCSTPLPQFRYISSTNTNIRQTFARITGRGGLIVLKNKVEGRGQ